MAGEAVDFTAAVAAAVEGVARAELDVLAVAVEECVDRVQRRRDVVVLGRVRYARRVRGVRRRRGRGPGPDSIKE